MWVVSTMPSLQQARQGGGRSCSEFRQTSQIKNELEKKIRLLFCSHRKNEALKNEESPMQDNDSDNSLNMFL